MSKAYWLELALVAAYTALIAKYNPDRIPTDPRARKHNFMCQCGWKACWGYTSSINIHYRKGATE